LLKFLQKDTALLFGPVEYSAATQRERILEIINGQLSRLDELRSKYEELSADDFWETFLRHLWYTLSADFLFYKTPAFVEGRNGE
jgi:hypothetical protein